MLQRLSLFRKCTILALIGVLMCLLPAWLYMRAALPPPGRALLQSLREALEAPARQQSARIAATLQLAGHELLQAATLTLPGQAYFDDFTRTIDGLYELNALAMASLNAALPLAGGLMAAFVRSITRPLAQAVALAGAVTQMDQTTQQNATLVEPMAAAAGSLRSQAGAPVEGVAVFRTQDARRGALQLEPA